MPKIYCCEKCNYTTLKNSSFSQHLKTGLHQNGKRKERSDKKTFVCEICQYNTDSTKNLISHRFNNHSTKEERKTGFPWYCETCDFGVFAKSMYEKHCQNKKHLKLTCKPLVTSTPSTPLAQEATFSYFQNNELAQQF